MRILRVYKLFRHFAGLQSLIYTLNQAYKELGLLLHIISRYWIGVMGYDHLLPFAVVGILCFASCVYICETELGAKEVPRIYLNRYYNWQARVKDQNGKSNFQIGILLIIFIQDKLHYFMSSTIFVKMNSTWTFPECFWWGLMTITTVGYDANPDVGHSLDLKIILHFKISYLYLDIYGKGFWRIVCDSWCLHSYLTDPNCCQQLCWVLQE